MLLRLSCLLPLLLGELFKAQTILSPAPSRVPDTTAALKSNELTLRSVPAAATLHLWLLSILTLSFWSSCTAVISLTGECKLAGIYRSKVKEDTPSNVHSQAQKMNKSLLILIQYFDYFSHENAIITQNRSFNIMLVLRTQPRAHTYQASTLVPGLAPSQPVHFRSLLFTNLSFWHTVPFNNTVLSEFSNQ